ncbi:hypothetical protein REPUB_Repub10bG0154800 [Reevesia pubescens]
MAYALVVVLVLAICHNAAHGVAAAAPPAAASPGITAAAREFLEAHNQARSAVGVGPLKWSEQLGNATSLLARYQRNKMGCQFANLTADHKYGANQLWGSGAAVTPRMAVDTWVKEKDYYDYATNSCAPNHRCGVYTQVVWKNSSELGCAQATCKDQVILTICFYNPPGNFVGEKPY